jgi:hypothetical protein
MPDREIRNRDRFTWRDEEDAARHVAVNGEHVSAGATDHHALVHQQFAAAEYDGARNARGVNGVTVVRNGECLTQ